MTPRCPRDIRPEKYLLGLLFFFPDLSKHHKIPPAMYRTSTLGAHQGGHATTCFLEGLLEGSLKDGCVRVLRRRCVRGSLGTGVLRRGVCVCVCVMEGA